MKRETITNRIGRSPRNRQQMTVLEEPAGKEAVTDYRVLRSDPGGKWASLSCIIHTGRTHQIRVAFEGVPSRPHSRRRNLRDQKKPRYESRDFCFMRGKLRFRHPVSGEEVNYEAPIPEEFLAFLLENYAPGEIGIGHSASKIQDPRSKIPGCREEGLTTSHIDTQKRGGQNSSMPLGSARPQKNAAAERVGTAAQPAMPVPCQ